MIIHPTNKIDDINEILSILNDDKDKKKKKNKHKKHSNKKKKSKSKNNKKDKKKKKHKKNKKKSNKKKKKDDGNNNTIITLDKSYYGSSNFLDSIFESFKVNGNVNVDLNINDGTIANILSVVSSMVLKLITKK